MDGWIKGMDLSTLLEVEDCGGKFFDGGKQGDAMAILKGYGMNLLRLRLWNHPYAEDGSPFGAGTNDLETVLRLAQRAKGLGIPWMLDFHYSDFWADPGKQRIPRAWEKLDEKGLLQAVETYTGEVLTRCREQGLAPAIVAVGNELTRGFLWPYGEVPRYGAMAALISAGIRAVRRSCPEASVMLHLDNGGNNELYRTWFDNYQKYGSEDFEYIGLSYYPFWHGTLKDLQYNMNDIALRYQKDLIVAEVSMGFTMEDYQEYEKLRDDQRNGMATKPELVEKIEHPMTPEGQAQFMQDFMTVIRNVPKGRGKGFCYWEPAWLPVPGSQWSTPAARAYMKEPSAGGNEWANQALFDYDGNALPALRTIRDFPKGA